MDTATALQLKLSLFGKAEKHGTWRGRLLVPHPIQQERIVVGHDQAGIYLLRGELRTFKDSWKVLFSKPQTTSVVNKCLNDVSSY